MLLLDFPPLPDLAADCFFLSVECWLRKLWIFRLTSPSSVQCSAQMQFLLWRRFPVFDLCTLAFWSPTIRVGPDRAQSTAQLPRFATFSSTWCRRRVALCSIRCDRENQFIAGKNLSGQVKIEVLSSTSNLVPSFLLQSLPHHDNATFVHV